MLIAVDFDGTIVVDAWPGIGEEIPDAVAAIKALAASGHQFILHTCRELDKLQEAKDWLSARRIAGAFIAFNGNCPLRTAIYDNDSRKIGADIYIDDKAIGCPKINGVIDWARILEMIKCNEK